MEYLEYAIEIEKAIEKIRKEDAKKVCIQLPDGLRPKAADIEQELRKNTNAEILIWAGSCFGSCDIPLELENMGVDLVLAWGHPAWKH